jgi:hypothetical protein
MTVLALYRELQPVTILCTVGGNSNLTAELTVKTNEDFGRLSVLRFRCWELLCVDKLRYPKVESLKPTNPYNI